MKRKYLSVVKTEGFTTLIQTNKPNYFKKLNKTGAVLERGITISPVYNISTISTELNSENLRKPNLPYVIDTTAYIPFSETEEALEIYKGIKRLSQINGELNINELETLGEKIKFILNNAFFQRQNDQTLVRLKKTTFIIWIICGILNTLSGKPLIYTLDYLVAILQLDLITLTEIVKSSSVSKEKKDYILNNLQNKGVNTDVIEIYSNIGLYTKHSESSAREILSKTR